jgi:hypothetical protein
LIVQEFDLSQLVDSTQPDMPNLVMPDMAMPKDESAELEV